MKETQTPRKDRRPKDSKSTSDHLKKPLKIAKKSFNAEFSSVLEDLSADSVTEDSSLCPLSEFLADPPLIRESIDSVTTLFGIEEASSKIAIRKDEQVIDSGDSDKELNSISCVEVEVWLNLLKQARDRASSLIEVSAESKKLLDALVDQTVKDFGLPKETCLNNVAVSEKTRALVFCFVVLLITMTVIVIFCCSSSRGTSCFYLPPT